MALATFKVKKEVIKQITNVVFKEITFKCINNEVRFLESSEEKVTQGLFTSIDYNLSKEVSELDEHDTGRLFMVKKAPVRAFADRCLGDNIIVSMTDTNITFTDDTNSLRFGEYRLEDLGTEKLTKQMINQIRDVSRLLVKDNIIYSAYMLDNDDYICTSAESRSYSKFKGDVDHVQWEFRINTEEVELIETCYRPNGYIDQDVWEYTILEHKKSEIFTHPSVIQMFFSTNMINNYIVNSGTTNISLFIGNPQTVIPAFSVITDDFQAITLVKDLGDKPT